MTREAPICCPGPRAGAPMVSAELPSYGAEGSGRPRVAAKRPPGGAVGRCPVVPTGREGVAGLETQMDPFLRNRCNSIGCLSAAPIIPTVRIRYPLGHQ